MPVEYTILPEAEAIGSKLYTEFKDWPDLPKVKYLQKIATKSKFAGQISKCTGKWKYLTQYDYVMEIWDDFWVKATAKQKEALIYHELYHVAFSEDDETGEITWQLKDHELEEFAEVVERYGTWNEALIKFKEILNKPEEVKNEIRAV
jgi:hypothetical protein